jgi:hypothetical protein
MTIFRRKYITETLNLNLIVKTVALLRTLLSGTRGKRK